MLHMNSTIGRIRNLHKLVFLTGIVSCLYVVSHLVQRILHSNMWNLYSWRKTKTVMCTRNGPSKPPPGFKTWEQQLISKTQCNFEIKVPSIIFSGMKIVSTHFHPIHHYQNHNSILSTPSACNHVEVFPCEPARPRVMHWVLMQYKHMAYWLNTHVAPFHIVLHCGTLGWQRCYSWHIFPVSDQLHTCRICVASLQGVSSQEWHSQWGIATQCSFNTHSECNAWLSQTNNNKRSKINTPSRWNEKLELCEENIA